MKKNRTITNIFFVLLCYGGILLLLLFSSDVSQGVKNGISLCLNIIIPSMFLFLILSSLIIGSELKYVIPKPFKPIRKLLKLSENEFSILLLSLLGGYPVGARLLAKEVKEKNITSEKAAKMLSFCVNGSPAFLISGIGVGIFSNQKAGVYLYIAQLFSCFFTAWIMSFFYKPQENNKMCRDVHTKKVGMSSLIIHSVTDSVKAMAMICGLTVTFSALMPLLSRLPADKGVLLFIKGLLEVTTGCNEIAGFSNQVTLLIISFFCSFGGLCVFMQLSAMLSSLDKNKISMKWFIELKIVNVLTTILITLLLSAISPIQGDLQSNAVVIASINTIINPAEFYYKTPFASILLLLLSIMLLFFTKKSDRI